jgi:predicted ATPase/DNA-binding winged helix-turn-helix (wHTH) protein
MTEAVAKAEKAQAIRFGPFTFEPQQRLLLEQTRPIPLGSRAMAILELLLKKPGTLVGKDEILAHVWPDTFIEEVSLRVHLSALRRAIGDGQDGRRYLVTVPGRGYQFVGAVQENTPALSASTPPLAASRRGRLPIPLTRVIGREAFVGAAADQLLQRRLVTIVGPGGIGKTTVAISICEHLHSRFTDGVCFVDLAGVTEAQGVAAALAAALGLSIFADDATAAVAATLQDRSMLLVLDCCERVVEGAATFVETLLRQSSGLHVLATSREQLRAEGERVLRLPTLAAPPLAAGLTAAEAMTYPAVQLFVERAAAIADRFELTDANADALAFICNRLDGIALAIELAAGHMSALDLSGLAALLHDRLELLVRGKRTSLPRHQTLRAVHDWSFETLSPTEKAVLCRLAVFEGAITISAARAVMASAGLTSDQILGAVSNLVDKSLVVADFNGPSVTYHLLDTTREYAREQLAARGETDQAAAQHARFYLGLAREAASDWAKQNTAAWLKAGFAAQLGNFRAALDWAFSPAGDCDLALGLSAAGVPLMFELAPVKEIRRRAAQALELMSNTPGVDQEAEIRMRAALGAAMMYNPGPVPGIAATWHQIFDAASAAGYSELHTRACWGLWTVYVYRAQPARGLEFGELYHAAGVAQNDRVKMLLGERIMGTAIHLIGDQRRARAMLQRMTDAYILYEHHWFTVGFEIDHGAMARATLARVHWLLGEPVTARRVAAESVGPVLAAGYPVACCYVLCEAAFPIAWLVGDVAAAEQAAQDLRRWADRNGLAIWQAAARCFELAVDTHQNGTITVEAAASALAAMRATGFTTHLSWLTGVLAEALGQAGQAAEGLAIVEAVLADIEQSGEAWCRAESLRVKAGLLAVLDKTSAAAITCLGQALHIAEAQGAAGWALRIQNDLAELKAPAEHADREETAATLH